jgi:uncharacterized protein YecE (DUF72 family)
MKFGKVDNPEKIDFTLPNDHPDTKKVLANTKKGEPLQAYVGCAKWNRQDLKKFYPRGTKDELAYYSTQFNSIELNATFYRIFPPEQFAKWREKTPNNFKFFPKLNQEISHWKRLNEVKEAVAHYLYSAVNLEDKLGTMFLQMHSDFAPKDFNRVQTFIEEWPKELPLAVEFRHTDWFGDKAVANELSDLLANNNVAHVLVDTAGRRDMLHMRLTNNEAFIRYVGANHESDYARLNDWVERLKIWVEQGLEHIHFFVHQNLEKASPYLSAYFINNLNKAIGTQLKPPTLPDDSMLF